jgi:hypothetical protein
MTVRIATCLTSVCYSEHHNLPFWSVDLHCLSSPSLRFHRPPFLGVALHCLEVSAAPPGWDGLIPTGNILNNRFTAKTQRPFSFNRLMNIAIDHISAQAILHSLVCK